MHIIIFLAFLSCLTPLSAQLCSCTQDPTQTPIQLVCTGDTQLFQGDTELYAGAWQTCSTTLFTSNLAFSAYTTYQSITLPYGGGFQVQGNLVIPLTTGFNNTVSFYTTPASGQTFAPNATLEIFGNLLVNGNFDAAVDIIIVHGNITVSQTGFLTLNPSTMVMVYGSIYASQSNLVFQGTSNNTEITIDGSITETGSGNITFAHANVSILGQINAPNSVLTIAAITNTRIRATAVSVHSATLQMLPTDRGQSNLNTTFNVLLVSSPITFPYVFVQAWTCGNYNVSASISTNAGLSVVLYAPPIRVNQGQYCCFEGIDYCICAQNSGQPLPAECQPVCTDWICDQVGFIVGWVIGGVLATALLSVSCTLFVRDFITTL